MTMMCSDKRCRHERWVFEFGHEIGMRIHGDVEMADPLAHLCDPIDVNGKDSSIRIGASCDIAAFVTITCADSHLRCVGLSPTIERAPVEIGDHVFIGQGAIILGGTIIGHHSVIGAGVVLRGQHILPHSLVRPPEPLIEQGFYERLRK